MFELILTDNFQYQSQSVDIDNIPRFGQRENIFISDNVKLAF